VEITESDEMFLRYSTPLTEISSIAAPGKTTQFDLLPLGGFSLRRSRIPWSPH
jgi:hypothetical protein